MSCHLIYYLGGGGLRGILQCGHSQVVHHIGVEGQELSSKCDDDDDDDSHDDDYDGDDHDHHDSHDDDVPER